MIILVSYSQVLQHTKLLDFLFRQLVFYYYYVNYKLTTLIPLGCV